MRRIPPTSSMMLRNPTASSLKRVFGIEIAGCVHCGGKLEIIPASRMPQIIAKIDRASRTLRGNWQQRGVRR